jgi:hypothetical protein
MRSSRHAVIDEEAATDLRARMDVDARQRMRVLGDDARDDRQIEPVERVRETMVNDGSDAGIAEKNLIEALCRRVAVIGCTNIAVEDLQNAGEIIGKFLHDGARRMFGIDQAVCGERSGKRQLTHDLGLEQFERLAERMADEVVHGAVTIGGDSAEAAGKQDVGYAGDGVREALRRWQIENQAVGTDRAG